SFILRQWQFIEAACAYGGCRLTDDYRFVRLKLPCQRIASSVIPCVDVIIFKMPEPGTLGIITHKGIRSGGIVFLQIINHCMQLSKASVNIPLDIADLITHTPEEDTGMISVAQDKIADISVCKLIEIRRIGDICLAVVLIEDLIEDEDSHPVTQFQ